MKRFTFILILFISLVGCKKYENGNMSLRTPERRLINDWKVMRDSRDEWQVSFKENGSFYKTIGGRSEYGNWEFSKDKNSIILSKMTGENETWHVVELNNVTFHFYIESKGNDTEDRYDFFANPKSEWD